MIKRIKQWLYNRFLDVWIKETLLAENRALQNQIVHLQAEIAVKDAYISGLTAGIKAQRRIVINNGEVKR